eukprot:13000025-Heterocapsa_arctica.AAC.1
MLAVDVGEVGDIGLQSHEARRHKVVDDRASRRMPMSPQTWERSEIFSAMSTRCGDRDAP